MESLSLWRLYVSNAFGLFGWQLSCLLWHCHFCNFCCFLCLCLLHMLCYKSLYLRRCFVGILKDVRDVALLSLIPHPMVMLCLLRCPLGSCFSCSSSLGCAVEIFSSGSLCARDCCLSQHCSTWLATRFVHSLESRVLIGWPLGLVTWSRLEHFGS